MAARVTASRGASGASVFPFSFFWRVFYVLGPTGWHQGTWYFLRQTTPYASVFSHMEIKFDQKKETATKLLSSIFDHRKIQKFNATTNLWNGIMKLCHWESVFHDLVSNTSSIKNSDITTRNLVNRDRIFFLSRITRTRLGLVWSPSFGPVSVTDLKNHHYWWLQFVMVPLCHTWCHHGMLTWPWSHQLAFLVIKNVR